MEDSPDEYGWMYSYESTMDGRLMITNFIGSLEHLKGFIERSKGDGQQRVPIICANLRWLRIYRDQYESVTGNSLMWDI